MNSLAVHACGMVTALGYNAPATLAALRGGVSAVSELPWVDFASGEPLRGAKVSLPQWWEGLGKLADLAAPAIDECLAGLAPALRKRVPILLGAAAPGRPGRVPGLDDDLLDEICFRLGHDVPVHSRVFALDQAGCAYALVEAQRLIREGLAERVVVAGVDSFLSEPTLEAYIERRRLMTPDNSNGFFPGEAGCAVLVGIADERGAGALKIIGLGLSHEEAHIEGTEPLRAVAMTQAVRQALDVAGITLKDVAWRITDISGEHYKFKEAAFVAGRLNGGERAVPLGLWHPIEYLGEIGAAILPCLLAWALHAARHGYAPGALALCHVGSDAGQRAAMVVHSAPARSD
jgi:3-oxoacyl-[acyl-carrier-protein] synthase-1